MKVTILIALMLVIASASATRSRNLSDSVGGTCPYAIARAREEATRG
jgi:hypothetical protein